MSNNKFGFSVIKDPGGNKLMRKSPICDFENLSKLIVEEKHGAIIVIDGERQVITGPGRYSLNTGQWMIFKGIQNVFSKGEPSHSSEVYFFDMARNVYRNICGVVKDCIAIDKETGTQVRANPEICFSVRISNPYSFEQMYKGENFSDEKISEYIINALSAQYRSEFYKEMSTKSILQVNAETVRFGNSVIRIASNFLSKHGLDVIDCSVTSLGIAPEDVRRLSDYYDSIREANIMAKQVKIIADSMFDGNLEKASNYYLQTQAVKNPNCNPVSWGIMMNMVNNRK